MSQICREAICLFQEECKDLLHFNRDVPTLVFDPKDANWSLNFHREYVSKNMPVLIKNASVNIKAYQKWNCDYLHNKLGNKEVVVAVTPNGYADGIANYKRSSDNACEDIFVLPEEVKMKFSSFIDNIKTPRSNYICYIQRQNSNLIEDFKELFNDVDTDISWARDVFGKSPDAVNFWMGDCRAITSMHKDFYENIYCVIRGQKDFILMPPTDLPYITYKNFKVGRYKNVTASGYEICLEIDINGSNKFVPWITNDPRDKFDSNSFKEANIYRVQVSEGDCLYLPSLWFHSVAQTQGCIAINYWYDMEFDVKYCYYKLLEMLLKK